MTLANTQYADAITKVGGYYNFVTLINRRLKELNNGQQPMVLPPAENGTTMVMGLPCAKAASGQMSADSSATPHRLPSTREIEGAGRGEIRRDVIT